MASLGHRLFVPLVLALGLTAQMVIYRSGLASEPIHSDAISYYVYLPSVVLHQSPRLWKLADEMYGGSFPEYTGIARWPNTSWWLNPHPIGVALLTLPFFVAAHVLTLWSNLPPHGFSLYYQIAASISGLFYGVAGLWLLQRLLLAHFTPGVSLATLVSLTLGSNLFHYLTFDAAYSHAYSFFLIAALLSLTPRWYEAPTPRRSALLGLISGLLVLTRHSHAIALLIPALYGVGSMTTVRARVAFLGRHATSVLTTIAVALLVLLPQLVLYRAITGSWTMNGYQLQPGGLTLAHPHLAGVLFGTQKGLFFWSPLLLLAVAGFAVMPRSLQPFRLPALIALGLLAWLIGSWYDWQFGSSYGHRGFTDVLEVLALPLASAYAWIASRPRAVVLAAALAVAVLTTVSVVQMLQYWMAILPAQDTTWEQYRGMFLRLM